MIRTRENVVVEASTLSNQITQGPAWANAANSFLRPPTYTAPTSFYSEDQKIWDESHGHGRENSCSHKTVRRHHLVTSPMTSSDMFVSGEWRNVFNGVIGMTAIESGYTPPFTGMVATTCSHTDDSDMSKWTVPNYSYDAVQAMWPEVEGKLSIINSLYELKDFKRLPQLINQTFKQWDFLRNLLTTTSATRKLLRSDVTFKSLVNTAAGNHLNIAFAVKPLMSDIRGVIDALTNVNRRVDNLLANADKNFVSHFSKALTPADLGLSSVSFEEATLDKGVYASANKIIRYHPMIRYTATMRYSYSYSRWQREHARLLGKLDAFGINLNPAIIWNAIPYSFVIDWIFNISRFLDSAKKGWLSPSVNVDWFTHSLKYTTIQERLSCPWEAIFELNGGATSQYRLHRVSNTVLDREVASYYVRRPTWPDMYRAIQLSGLSTTEITLGTSLTASILSSRR